MTAVFSILFLTLTQTGLSGSMTEQAIACIREIAHLERPLTKEEERRARELQSSAESEGRSDLANLLRFGIVAPASDRNQYLGKSLTAEIDRRLGWERFGMMAGIWIDEIRTDRYRSVRERVSQICAEIDGIPFRGDGTVDWETATEDQKEKILQRVDDTGDFGLVGRHRRNENLLPEEWEKFQKLSNGWEQTKKRLYGGHFEKLKTIMYEEPTNVSPFLGNLERLTQMAGTGRWNFGVPWWMHSDRVGVAHVTAETSLSPLKKLYGPNSKRLFFWPLKILRSEPKMTTRLELNRIRVAENQILNKTGQYYETKTVEMFAKDEKNRWQPFLFERVGPSLFPLHTFGGKPVPAACAECHFYDGEFHPLPKMIKTPSDLRAVGFRDFDLIHGLLDPKNN